MKIGWFLNAHGAGHRNRLAALLPYFSASTQLTTLSSAEIRLGRSSVIVSHRTLPSYNQPARCSYLRKQVWREFHGLQMNGGGNAPFFSALTAWIVDWQPDLIVVDVALEAALAARLCGVPVIYMRQHGKRWDLGHRIAYEASFALLAPFSEHMEQADCPAWISKKTIYVGGFCRFEQTPDLHPSPFLTDGCNVVVMVGSGGTNITGDAIATAAVATPHWNWYVLGKVSPSFKAATNVRLLGQVADVYPYLRHASLVIGNAGHNTVMEVGATRAPFLCLPAQRPFKEQLCKAEVLNQLNLAVVRHDWPQSDDWAAILTQAQQQNKHTWKTLINSTAPQQAIQFIEASGRRYLATAA